MTEQWTQDDMLAYLGKKREPATSLARQKPKINEWPDGCLFSVTLPIELTNGNDGRGFHWSKAAKRRKKYESILIEQGHFRKPFECLVRVVVVRILGPRQRLWDADSTTRGSLKELVDAAVVCGWFQDDSPKWIKSVEVVQDKEHRDQGPATRVDVWQA